MRFTGAIYLIILGLVVAVFGGGFAWLMWRSFERASGQRDWEEGSCQILQSEVIERKIGENVSTEYSYGLLFGYEVDGEGMSSDQYSLRGNSWSHSRVPATELIERFPAGTKQICYVNPDNPAQAVLKRDSKGPGYSLWFPLLLMVGGLGVVSGGCRNLRRARRQQA